MANKIAGYRFIYNSIPSESYNASLVFINESYTDRPSGSEVTFYTDTIRRNPKVLYLDAQQSPVLEFGIEVVFDNPVDIYTLSKVKDWLGGELNFRKLQICADNFSTFYFNCYINLEEQLMYAGGYRGLRATVTCDSPWAWENPRNKNYTLTPDSTNNIVFNNISADSELLKPILSFTMDTTGDFSIVNLSNQNRETLFTGISAGETITLDCQYGFLTSSTGLLRLGNFNKQILRLAKGTNNLVVTGRAKSMIITYQNAKRLGGGWY